MYSSPLLHLRQCLVVVALHKFPCQIKLAYFVTTKQIVIKCCHPQSKDAVQWVAVPIDNYVHTCCYGKPPVYREESLVTRFFID